MIRRSWFYQQFLRPTSKDEDQKRRESILNILLLGSFFLAMAAVAVVVSDLIRLGPSYRGISLYLAVLPAVIFAGLYRLNRTRWRPLAAYSFVGIFALMGIYTLYTWGFTLPTGLLVNVLTITMAGVLIGTRLAFISAGVLSLLLVIIAQLQVKGIIQADTYWHSEQGVMGDAVVFVVILLVITLVSWLSNREIERSLQRARRSERALRQERDLLEVKVEERTRQLKQAQLEKIIQLYRFAEFGRLATGLFHDLANPITTVSVNLQRLQTKKRSLSVDRANEAMRRLEHFIKAAQKQMKRQEERTLFDIREETEQVVRVLDHRTKESQAHVKLDIPKGIILHGNPIKLYQVLSNVITNALDAYRTTKVPSSERWIKIEAKTNNRQAIITVTDQAGGIAPEHLDRIFEPFFTTKSFEEGTGIGLSISQSIMEKDFGGTLTAKSLPGQGTTFTLTFSLSQLSVQSRA